MAEKNNDSNNSTTDELMSEDPEPYLEIPCGGSDLEGSNSLRALALMAMARRELDTALSRFTSALNIGPVCSSASLLAERANCLLELRRPNAAISDCNRALQIDENCVEALRCRGRAHRFLGRWIASLNDLVAAQAICYDPNVEAMLTIVKKKVDDTTTPDETPSLKDKWNNLSTGQKLAVGVTAGVLAAPVAAYAGVCAIGLSSVGPVAGGWFAANMGAGLAAGSTMSVLQSAVMTGSIYGYAAAAGGTVGLATAATAAATSDGKEAAPTPADAATDQPPADPPMPGNSKDDHMSDR